MKRFGISLLALWVAILAPPALSADVLVLEIAGNTTGTVEIELLPDLAPNHVERIKTLTELGAYDNVAFHRVIEGFMAQTGDVEYGNRDANALQAAGRGGSDLPNLQSEFTDTPYTRGVVGMARSNDPHSANSQFFIMFADAPHLDGAYTVFGRVITGMDIVDAIKRGEGPGFQDPDYIQRASIRSDDE
ncbi:MAG: peptidylprolyl isomerase [Rhodobacteraceae bacterium]|nr:peptidylprolyl isomerase [Paracoccaceae bacterium]